MPRRSQKCTGGPSRSQERPGASRSQRQQQPPGATRGTGNDPGGDSKPRASPEPRRRAGHTHAWRRGKIPSVAQPSKSGADCLEFLWSTSPLGHFSAHEFLFSFWFPFTWGNLSAHQFLLSFWFHFTWGASFCTPLSRPPPSLALATNPRT